LNAIARIVRRTRGAVVIAALSLLPGVALARGEPAGASGEAKQEFENTLGMKFLPVPGTRVWFSIWLTRVRDFAAFVRATGYDASQGVYSLAGKGWVQRGDSWQNPGFHQGDTHPVCAVSWIDAQAFCDWLTKKERASGRIRSRQSYRLPTDREWMVAVGLLENVSGRPSKAADIFSWGNRWPPPAGAGNYAGQEAQDEMWPAEWPPIPGYNDGFPRTSPVGAFRPNQFGLFDMSGNVWEWCGDLYDPKGTTRVVRGAAYRVYLPDLIKLNRRGDGKPDSRYVHRGFRCVLTADQNPDESADR
jgi:formylglycine-generating enzyme required for sulfatase activity